jgi:hypothetical protein
MTLAKNVTVNGGSRMVALLNTGTVETAASFRGDFSNAILRTEGGKVTISDGTWNNSNAGSDGYSVLIFNKGIDTSLAAEDAANVTITGGTFNSKRGCGTNNIASGTSNLTITGGTFDGTTGVFWPSAGTLTLGNADGTGPSFTDWTCFEISSGTVVFNGGTYNASKYTTQKFETSAAVTAYDGSSGLKGYTDAVTIIAYRNESAKGTHTAYDVVPLSVTINGGTFSSAKNYAVRYVDCNSNTASSAKKAEYNYTPTLKINGGTFNSAVDLSTATDDSIKTSISGGTFTENMTKYCVSGKAAYQDTDKNTYTVKDVESVTVTESTVVENETTAGNNTVTVSSAIQGTNEEKAAIAEAAQSVALASTTTDSTASVIVPDETASDTETQAALDKLQASGIITVAEDGTIQAGDAKATVTLVYEVYLAVEATGYTTDENTNTNTLTLDITPKYDVKATIATDGVHQTQDNTVTVATGKTATVTQSVDVFVDLPDGFVDEEVTTAYVTHEHEGTTYLYKGTINEKNVLTFTNPNGFSSFTISTKAPEGSWINRSGEGAKEFDSLQKAVDDVQNDEIISFEADNDDMLAAQ